MNVRSAILFPAALAGLVLVSSVTAVRAEPAPALSALARMPVKEVTVFKDGHAFVLHSGPMPVDAKGGVVLDYLPMPVMGTFWPFSNDKACKLSAVTASQSRVAVERTAMTIRELLEANVGAEVTLTETPVGWAPGGVGVPPPTAPKTTGTILGILARSSDELEKTAPPGSGEMLPQKSNLLLIKTADGTKTVPVERILDATFKGDFKKAGSEEEFRNLLTLKLDWAGGQAGKTADVGMLYLQRGLRWIPNYKITIDGKGSALVKLQATLINELTDLEGVTCNLVIGVPSFQFKGTNDPMGLQQTVAQLSQYFREDSQMGGQMMSNAIMTQAARMTEARPSRPAPAAGGPADLGPELAGGEKAEDLYVFPVKNVTLRKGQRMVVPVSEVTVPYKDVFVLDIPYAPPQEVFKNFAGQQQAEVARLLAAPKVMHRIRLDNKGASPFTTAPALILRDDRILAQGMMTYTSSGAQTDLTLTAAVDVQVKKTDNETRREPRAASWDGYEYARVDLSGTVTLTNYTAKPLTLEVVRNVLGNVTSADMDGKIEMVNVLEDPTYAPAGGAGPYSYYPAWWGWYNWPYWWRHFNGMGRVTWHLTLEPGKSADLKYTWNYYWR
jgi:hypothetical protein